MNNEFTTWLILMMVIMLLWDSPDSEPAGVQAVRANVAPVTSQVEAE